MLMYQIKLSPVNVGLHKFGINIYEDLSSFYVKTTKCKVYSFNKA